MDKETLSNYGWIVICVLVLSVMIALATPFGSFISDAVQNTTEGLFKTEQSALEKGLKASGIELEGVEFGDVNTVDSATSVELPFDNYDHDAPELNIRGVLPTGATYNAVIVKDMFDLKCYNCNYDNQDPYSDQCESCGYTTRSYLGRFETGTEFVDTIPDTPNFGDVLTYGDYEYLYIGGNWEVSVIDKNEVEYCPLLEKIGNSDIYILNAFNGCENLIVPPVMPESVGEINNAFNGCTSLTTIYIPNVCAMNNAFNDCVSLTNIYYEGTIEQWNNNIENYMFNYLFDDVPATVVHCSDGDVTI